MSKIRFTKMVGAGNDFIVFDNRKLTFKKDLKEVARRFCDRKRSIGGDGVLFLERSKIADVRMRIFNPDGSEADMCGNGVRCLAGFAIQKKIKKDRLTVQTPAGLIDTQVFRDTVKARITNPRDMKLDISIPLAGGVVKAHFINTGVPHTVVMLDSVEGHDVYGMGRAIRNHALFAPKGTNVNFVAVKGRQIHARTYERGVEDETLSCGTGSTASALIAAALRGFGSPLSVLTHGGDALKVYFSKRDSQFHDVYLEGPVHVSFEGSVTL
ncbi:MAG: diaminopimelate epimerase [Candidatus Omnitrophica bacterium]|nr:diaminopimelate epimerase [Candidatus Omnitrophota bacterium]